MLDSRIELLNSRLLPSLSRSSTDRVFFIEAEPSESTLLRHNSAPPGQLSRPTIDTGPLARSSTPVPSRSTNGMNGLGAGDMNVNRKSTLGVPATNKKRTSMQGPSSGRLAKVIGDLYLLAGKLSDASYW